MSTRNHLAGAPTPATLSNMLDQSARIKGVVDGCALELCEVNAALKQQLMEDAALSEVGHALIRTKSVGGKVQEVADELSAIGAALADEVRQRELLEGQLIAIKAREKAARYAAFHDPLTGLPNRALFNDRLEHALSQARRHGWSLAVMFIDLDDFKKVNDSYGHDIGDRVLQIAGRRISYTLRDEDTTSRQGGDEFLSLLMEVSGEAALAAIAEKIIKAIELPYEIGACTVPVFPRISASIGIALFPKNGMVAKDLVKNADAAMYRAKRSRSKVAFVS